MPIPKRLTTILLLAFSLAGCTTPSSSSGTPPTSAAWSQGNFHIQFQAGPRGENGRSYSYYQIHHTAPGGPEYALTTESAHTLDGFGCVTNGDPKNWIRIIPDPNGKAFIIEEEIPNDCGPCSNFLYVRLVPDGSLKATYLQLPMQAIGPMGGIDSEFPKIRSLSGNLLTYQYSTGPSVTKPVDQIDSTNHPTPPG